MPRSFVPERHNAGPSVPDDRAIDRRAGAVAGPSVGPDSSRDVTQEDFLFHLYRGSELLQENRVLEAKEELEYALTMQPLDAKGQDLLGAVYFRLGLYPRAIQIYEGLVAQFPRDVSVKINLALGYLKTGQPEPARQVLKDAVGLSPEHKRAWGYLGLALQKLGEFEQAQVAFERGGHAMMAKRVTEWRRRSLLPADSVAPPEVERGVREAAETAFSELDTGDLRFALAEPTPPRPADGPWHTLEPGEPTKVSRPSQRTLALTHSANVDPVHEIATVSPPGLAVRSAASPAKNALVLPVPSLLAFPADARVAMHGSGVLQVRITEEPAAPFAGRLDAVRVVEGVATTRIVHRRVRDAETNEILGGIGSPFVRVTGTARLLFGARPGHNIALVALDDELAFVREDLLLGFELHLGFENGRVAFEPATEGGRPGADGTPVVQLRGKGGLALELGGKLASVPSGPGGSLLIRREWIVGWLGRLMVRALPPSESPSGQRGLVAFSGEGTVLVCTG